MSTKNEWQKLRARYKSVRQYSSRRVLKSKKDLEDFANWLVDQGAEILLNPCQYESLRFYLNNELGIVWEKGTGNLLAHDMGIKYESEVSCKKAKISNKAKSTPIVFEYCFACKEVQELNCDQCSVCHSYIRFQE